MNSLIEVRDTCVTDSGYMYTHGRTSQVRGAPSLKTRHVSRAHQTDGRVRGDGGHELGKGSAGLKDTCNIDTTCNSEVGCNSDVEASSAGQTLDGSRLGLGYAAARRAPRRRSVTSESAEEAGAA
eukprot:538281-Pyramimonas_sp.AAC.2